MIRRVTGCMVLGVSLVSVPMESRARGFALQIGDVATALKRGVVRTGAGVMMGDSSDFYGVRATYGLKDSLNVFVDVGMVDPHQGFVDITEPNLGLQVGAMYALPIGLRSSVDQAARVTVFGSFVEQIDLVGLTAAWVASYDVKGILHDFSIYAGVGVDYLYWNQALGTESGYDADVLASAGTLYLLNKMFSVYAEVSYVGELFLGGGARIEF